MRLLCLTSRLPFPPDRGDRVRAYHFFKELSRDHELHLVSFSDNTTRVPQALESMCRTIHLVHRNAFASMVGAVPYLVSSRPLQVGYYRSRRMRKLVEGLVRSFPFDAVYVQMFRMAQYVAGYTHLYRILDLTDVVSTAAASSLKYRRGLWRAVYKSEIPRIAAYESQLGCSFQEVWLVSEKEKSLLALNCPGGNLQVVPNGVDTTAFKPLGAVPDPGTLVFVGHMGVFHNQDAAESLARDILPRVREQVPRATLKIVGSCPGSRIRRLGRLPGVKVTGYVKDLNRILNASCVFVAPLRFAGGVQNKVMEAMAAGCPVVASPQVNAGLEAEPDRELLVAEGPLATADGIITLLQDPEKRKKVSEAGRRFLFSRFGWKSVGDRMKAVERSLAE